MTHGAFHLLWWLIVGHAFADFVLQSGAMALGKSRHHQRAPGEPPWFYWLTAHALTHGGVVGVVTGSTGLAIAESAAHWAIDLGKCEHLYGFNTDQLLHVLCKLVWLWILLGI